MASFTPYPPPPPNPVIDTPPAVAAVRGPLGSLRTSGLNK